MTHQKPRITIWTCVLTFTCLVLSIGQTPALPRAVWIAVRTDGQPGTGTITDPYDGSTQAKFDGLMDGWQNTPDLIINLGDGVFQTSVTKTWRVQRGWIIRGQGIDRTTLKLVGSLAGVSGGVSALVSGYYLTTVADNSVVRDLTVDCNWGELATTASVGAGSSTIADGITTTGSSTIAFAATTIAPGSDGVNLGLSPGTINVVSTADFSPSGTLYIQTTYGYWAVTYTGKTATSFTGCAGGAGILSTGGSVSTARLNFAHEFARSVSGTGIPISATILRLPKTTIATGSTGASLPQSTINVSSTSEFASAGTMIVETSTNRLQVVAYTGKTATSFTGCTGGTGTMTTGGNITTMTQAVISASATAAGSNISLTLGGEPNVKIGAIYLTGSNILIERVKSINSFGSGDNHQELFCIGVNAPDNQISSAVTSTGNTIRFCQVESIYGTYGAPYALHGTLYGDGNIGTISQAAAYGNTATGVNDGFPYVFTSGGINAAHIESSEVVNNTFVDCFSAYYQDTGNLKGILIANNTVVRGWYGVSVRTGEPNPQDIRVIGNNLNIQNRNIGGHNYGIIMESDGSERTTQFYCAQNKITFDHNGAGYNGFRHLWFFNLVDSTIVNNTCDEWDYGANCSPINVRLQNNRTPAGAMLNSICESLADNILPPQK